MFSFSRAKYSNSISTKLCVIFILAFTFFSKPGWSMEVDKEKRPSTRSLIYPCSDNFKDGRKRIMDTQDPYYRIHGQLEITYKSKKKTGIGSGVLVGPRHVLTAAHNVFDEEYKEAEEITFNAGRNGEKKPYGSYKMVKYFCHKKWKENYEHEYDLALVILDYPIGKKIGWAGIYAASDSNLKKLIVNMTGYPADKKDEGEDGTTMWTSKGKIDPDYIRPKDFFLNNFYTFHGQSGSGVWIKKEGPYVVGVHTHKGERKNKTVDNVSVRITEKKIKLIQQWREQSTEKSRKDKERKKSKKKYHPKHRKDPSD